MLMRWIIGLSLWVIATFAIRTETVTPGVGAIMLLVAVLIVAGPVMLRLFALALDIFTGV